MLWRGGRRSDNIEDRRGVGGGFGGGGFGGGRTVGVGGGLGLLVIIVVAMLFGVDPMTLLQGVDPGTGGTGYSQDQSYSGDQGTIGTSESDDEMKQFVEVVLADTEDTWTEIFAKGGARYEAPTLVLFSGQTNSACGFADSAVGPFYCPGDSKVYIDLAFYDELRQRFQAPGDFAQAYVIAHEVGHHIQHLLGTTDNVSSFSGATGGSVRIGLQADCYAGIWAHHMAQQGDASQHIVIEEGDVEEALNAASAIGDDTLQKKTQGRVVPDSFTHGTSAQRMRWFKTGLQTGDIGACDTFGAKQL